MTDNHGEWGSEFPEFQAAEQIIRQSRTFALVELAMRTCAAAIRDSRIAATLHQRSREFAALPIAVRVRLIGVPIAVAAVTHLALLTLVPVRLAPALPRSLWVIVALAALGAVAGAPVLTAAWLESRAARGPARSRTPPVGPGTHTP